MFVVERSARGHRYLYLVESVREGKVVRQRTIKALGRKDHLIASGELDRLATSIARHSERSIIISDIEAGNVSALRIGGPLLFGRLRERLGIGLSPQAFRSFPSQGQRACCRIGASAVGTPVQLAVSLG